MYIHYHALPLFFDVSREYANGIFHAVDGNIIQRSEREKRVDFWILWLLFPEVVIHISGEGKKLKLILLWVKGGNRRSTQCNWTIIKWWVIKTREGVRRTPDVLLFWTRLKGFCLWRKTLELKSKGLFILAYQIPKGQKL